MIRAILLLTLVAIVRGYQVLLEGGGTQQICSGMWGGAAEIEGTSPPPLAELTPQSSSPLRPAVRSPSSFSSPATPVSWASRPPALA